MNLYLGRQHPESDRPRALIGELRDALDSTAQLITVYLNGVRMVLRKDTLKIRKVAGQLTAEQQPVADTEEQVIVIAGELNLGIFGALLRKLQNLSHSLARQQRSIGSPQIGEFKCLLHHGQPMTIRCNHRDTGGLQNQECTVQSKP